ncbi:hypothetical protein F5Y16DRAFT_401015 [Xylariaceae sp. FL0255]|nr:hypothetical protein F5Y16DRAFT_401015 [Xylariaceae sp. FL0255]
MELSPPVSLAKFNLEIACDDTTQYISVEQVKEAAALAERGIQKLRNVSQKSKTLFYVPLLLPSAHIAAIEIQISPVLDPPSPNPPFLVSVCFITCHEIGNFLEETQWLYEQLQLVYNTYIVAIRWIIGPDWSRFALSNDGAAKFRLARSAEQTSSISYDASEFRPWRARGGIQASNNIEQTIPPKLH